MQIIFTTVAFQQLRKLDRAAQKRIDEKLKFYLAQQNPLGFAEPLHDPRFGSWRFRIGEWRVLFDLENDTIIVLRAGHRKDIYK